MPPPESEVRSARRRIPRSSRLRRSSAHCCDGPTSSWTVGGPSRTAVPTRHRLRIEATTMTKASAGWCGSDGASQAGSGASTKHRPTTDHFRSPSWNSGIGNSRHWSARTRRRPTRQREGRRGRRKSAGARSDRGNSSAAERLEPARTSETSTGFRDRHPTGRGRGLGRCGRGEPRHVTRGLESDRWWGRRRSRGL